MCSVRSSVFCLCLPSPTVKFFSFIVGYLFATGCPHIFMVIELAVRIFVRRIKSTRLFGFKCMWAFTAIVFDIFRQSNAMNRVSAKSSES